MNTNIIIFYIFHKMYCNSRKYYRNFVRKEKCKYCGYCMNNNSIFMAQRYIPGKISKKLRSALVLQSLDSILVSRKTSKIKPNSTINKYAVINSLKSDNNYAFVQKVMIKMQKSLNSGYTKKNETEYNRKKSAAQLTPKKMPLLKYSETKSCNQPNYCGLLRYRKWWERTQADISVSGKLITGIPIFIEENTLRIINKEYSYFIPLEKVDFIRTNDGLNSCHDS